MAKGEKDYTTDYPKMFPSWIIDASKKAGEIAGVMTSTNPCLM